MSCRRRPSQLLVGSTHTSKLDRSDEPFTPRLSHAHLAMPCYPWSTAHKSPKKARPFTLTLATLMLRGLSCSRSFAEIGGRRCDGGLPLRQRGSPAHRSSAPCRRRSDHSAEERAVPCRAQPQQERLKCRVQDPVAAQRAWFCFNWMQKKAHGGNRD